MPPKTPTPREKYVRGRCKASLKNRVINYCKNPQVDMDESDLVRQAVSEFLVSEERRLGVNLDVPDNFTKLHGRSGVNMKPPVDKSEAEIARINLDKAREIRTPVGEKK